MNLRKILNLPNTEQTQVLLADVERVQKRCEELAATERKEQKENQKSRDSRCPQCRAKQDMIVDRIALVEGKGQVTGNILRVAGSVAIGTNPVNHCNNCTHEWEKFKTKTITNLAVMKVILNYLSDILRDPERNKRYSWKGEAIEIFTDCHAEAILMVQNKYKRSVRYPQNIRHLRKKFKSIFDEKNETDNNIGS